ncbi:MAG: hypothetical protein ACR2RA_26235 [Geminicoccaceae bacterium]
MTGATRALTLARFLALAVVVLAMSSGKVDAQATPADPDWPCVQRLLPEIAGGMVWAGPPLDDAAPPGDDRTFGELAKELAARRVPIEDAEKQIADYAGTLGDQGKTDTLTALFKATLEIINDDRTSIIAGIKKFSRGQRTLAAKINARNEEIQAMDRSDILKHDAAVAERDWDVRIFEDRRQSLTYLCEQPVLLEQRAFALARTLADHLE